VIGGGGRAQVEAPALAGSEARRLALIEDGAGAAAAAVAHRLHAFEHYHPLEALHRPEGGRGIHPVGAGVVDEGAVEHDVDVGLAEAAQPRFEAVAAHTAEGHTRGATQDLSTVTDSATELGPGFDDRALRQIECFCSDLDRGPDHRAILAVRRRRRICSLSLKGRVCEDANGNATGDDGDSAASTKL